MNKFFERFITLLAFGFLTFAILFTVHVKAENRPMERPVMPSMFEGFEGDFGWEWFPSIPHAIFFVGSITAPEGDVSYQAEHLKLALQQHPEIAVVVLHSGGGSVATGAMIADIIHENELFTYVPKDAECNSACGFMWLAGKQRVLDGTLGAHAVSLGHYGDTIQVSLSEAYAEVQSFMGNLMAWMYKYDVPTLYYTWMMLTPAEDMHSFSELEEAELVTGEDTERYDHIDEFVGYKYAYLRALREWTEYDRERRTAD